MKGRNIVTSVSVTSTPGLALACWTVAIPAGAPLNTQRLKVHYRASATETIQHQMRPRLAMATH